MPRHADDNYLARKEFTLRRVFPGATPERVWKAWTDPEEAAQWWWGSMAKEGAWAEIDLRVGGAFRVYCKYPGGVDQGEGWSGMCGFFAVVEPHERLLYSLHWDANVVYNQNGRLAPDEIIDVRFAAVEGGTEVTASHRGIPDEAEAWKHHEAGFNETLDFLAKLLGE